MGLSYSNMPILKIWDYFSFSVDSLSERIKLQKITYLLSMFGFSGFEQYKKSHNIYIHGPYSSLVADDAYKISNENITSNKNIQYTSHDEVLLNLIKEIDEKLLTKNMPKYSNYELVADITYFSKKHPSWDSEQIFEELRNKKDYFGDKEYFKKAEQFLKTKDLI